MKRILAAAAFLAAASLTGCASAPTPAGPGPAVSDGSPQGSFQGSYSTHPNPPPEGPVAGSFQGAYSTPPNPQPGKPVQTDFSKPANSD